MLKQVLAQLGCQYPCSQCYKGTCLKSCTNDDYFGVDHCFIDLPQCYSSDDSYLVGSVCEFGCARGEYRNTSNKTCQSCHSDCLECSGGNSTDCTSCHTNYYLSTQLDQTINASPQIGSCVQKSSPPFTTKHILVSHRQQDLNQTKSQTDRQGGSSDPYSDIRSAINRAEDQMAPFNDNSVTVTIYLTKGPHFITNNDTFYEPLGRFDPTNQNYHLIIKPLFSDNPFGISDPSLVVPEGEKVTVVNKIGAYFRFEVPHSLEIQSIIFDSIDSLGKWNDACLGSHKKICKFDSMSGTINDDPDSGESCECQAPTTQSLNNCMSPLPTSFIRLDYKGVSYSTPKSVLLNQTEFNHFFYPLGALIDVAGGPGFVNIIDSKFDKFSTCGAIVKNQNDLYIGQRKTGSQTSQNFAWISEDVDQKNIEEAAIHVYTSQVNGCNSPESDSAYGTNCAYVNIEGSQFKDFDYFFHSELSLGGSASGKVQKYQSSKFNKLRGSILHLQDYNGLVRVTDSSFENVFLKRKDCYYNETKGYFEPYIQSQYYAETTFSEMEYLKVQNPIIITQNRHGLLFKNNKVKSTSGTKGFLYATIARDNKHVSLIQNNTFESVGGFYGSGVIHVALFEQAYQINSSYQYTCGGVTIRDNTFERCFGCNETAPIIRVQCGSAETEDNFQDYGYETTLLADWSNNISQITDELVTLSFGSDVEQGLTSRTVLLDGNSFTKNHRGSGSQVILVSHVPGVTVSNTVIELSSSFSHVNMQNSQFKSDYQAAFGNIDLLSQFSNITYQDPGQLLKISQGLWVNVTNFNATSNLFGKSSSLSYGVIGLYEPQVSVNLEDLTFKALESSDCSNTYASVYGSIEAHCGSVQAGLVSYSLLHLSEASSNLFTPSFVINRTTLEDINYSHNTNLISLLLRADNAKIKQQDITMESITAKNIGAPSNSLITWVGARLTLRNLIVQNSQFYFIVGTSTVSDELQHSLTIQNVKVTQSECLTCFRIETNNYYDFTLKNIDPDEHYFDQLEISNYFILFKYTILNAFGTNTLQNLRFSLISRRDSNTNMVLIGSDKGGTYNFKNIEFNSRPSRDGAQFIQFTNIVDKTGITTQGLSMISVSSSNSIGISQPIVVSGATLSVTFNSNTIKGVVQTDREGVIAVKGSTVADNNSHYESNQSQQGGIYSISDSASTVTIDHGTFVSNTAILKGGVIFQQAGTLTVSNSNFTKNKALSFGGVYSNLGEGVFKFYDSDFIENQSQQLGSAIHSLSNPDVSGNQIKNCVFGENKASVFGTINLIFTETKIQNITVRNNYASRKTEGVSLTQSTVSIVDSFFYNETTSTMRDLDEMTGSLLYITEESELTLTGTTFTGGKAISGGAVQVQGSASLEADNCTFYNNEATGKGGDIYGISYSNITVTNSKFSHSSSAVALIQAVALSNFMHNQFIAYENQNELIYVQEAKINFQNNTVKGFYSPDYSVFHGVSTTQVQIESSTFSDIIAQHTVNLEFTKVPDITQDNHKISNSVFTNIQGFENGAGIAFTNTNGVIQGCNFTSVSNSQFTKRGGAIFITQTGDTAVKIDSNRFHQCSAYLGGGIAFGNYLPEIKDNSFSSNTALLSGPDISSYPISVKIITKAEYEQIQTKINYLDSEAQAGNRDKIDITAIQALIATEKQSFLSSLTRQLSQREQQPEWRTFKTRSRTLQDNTITMRSGSRADTIYLGLFDNYNQISTDLDQSGDSSVTAVLNKAQQSSISGVLSNFNEQFETQGVFAVERAVITAEPGTTASLVFTATFDSSKALSDTSATMVTQSITLQNCNSGDAFLDTGQCRVCDAGTYSLIAPVSPTSCKTCNDNANCFEGDKIGPKAGYWRSSSSSQNFIKCFNQKACLGSTNDQNYQPEGTCETGYNGILCAQCDSNYVRNGSFQCAKCPQMWQNIVLMIFILLVAIGVIIVVIKVTLSSQMQARSPFSAYFKIMTNHIHLIFLTASFDLNWPSLIQNFFDSTEPVANVGDRIISIDCFMDTSKGFQAIPRPYVYLLIYLFLPFVILIFSLIIWKIIHRHNKKLMCNRTITTTIILLFFVHPSITTLLIRVFHCYDIDNQFHLVRDLSQKCWTADHLAWALGGALPGILIWGIGIPLSAFVILYKVRYDLDKDFIKEKYGFLTNGYKKRNYYWESVIMFRKVAMIFITVFLSSLGRIVQALVVILLLIVYLFATMRKKPYITRRLNQLEITSLLTSSITIYCGVFFMTSRDSTDPTFTPNVDMTLSEQSKWVLVITIVISNLIFLYLWIFFFFKDLRIYLAKKSKRFFKLCCICCKFKNFAKSKLEIFKSEQDAQIVNEIENLEAELEIIKRKYIWNKKFREKWQFEDFLRATSRELDSLDLDPMKLKVYRDIHSLEESQARGEKKEEEQIEYEDRVGEQLNTDPKHKKSAASMNALRRMAPITPEDVGIQLIRPTLKLRQPSGTQLGK